MNLYGSDKPDLRFGLQMKDFGPFAQKGGFEVFKKVVEGGGVVKALVAPGCGEYSRKQITELEAVAKVYGAAGLAWMKVTEAGLDGGVSKFYAEQAAAIRTALGAKPGDLDPPGGRGLPQGLRLPRRRARAARQGPEARRSGGRSSSAGSSTSPSSSGTRRRRSGTRRTTCSPCRRRGSWRTSRRGPAR